MKSISTESYLIYENLLQNNPALKVNRTQRNAIEQRNFVTKPIQSYNIPLSSEGQSGTSPSLAIAGGHTALQKRFPARNTHNLQVKRKLEADSSLAAIRD